VDDEEILFIGRRAAQDEVIFRPSEVSAAQGQSSKRDERPSTGATSEVPDKEEALDPKARHQAKEAIAQLVRSLVKGRDVVVSTAGGGTLECTAVLDKGLTTLSFRRRASVLTVRKIPLENVLEVVTDSVPGAERYGFGRGAVVRLRLDSNKNNSLSIELGTQEDCDSFVSCIRACAKHQRSITLPRHSAQGLQEDEADLPSVPSTVVRTVSRVATLLRDAGLPTESLKAAGTAAAAEAPVDAAETPYALEPKRHIEVSVSTGHSVAASTAASLDPSMPPVEKSEAQPSQSEKGETQMSEVHKSEAGTCDVEWSEARPGKTEGNEAGLGGIEESEEADSGCIMHRT